MISLASESYGNMLDSDGEGISYRDFLQEAADLRFLLAAIFHISSSDGGHVTSKVTIPMTASLDSFIIANLFGLRQTSRYCVPPVKRTYGLEVRKF